MKNRFILSAFILVFATSCATRDSLRQANRRISEINNEVSALDRQNAELKDSLFSLHHQLDGLNRTSDQCQAELAEVRNSKDAVTQRFLELSRCLEEQGDSLQMIKRKAIKDFSAFDNSTIDVKYRNGMVYISMQDQFMFKSGSTSINSGGKKALLVIANILSEYNHITAIVVGNTDSISIVKGHKDNWSLSTERSNTIVRYLINHYGVNPARLIAAGKSKFSPVASNHTPDGRAKNRRTDIIFNPDLNKLWLLSQKYP
jgi:chemotaxis protein MotB